MKMFTEYKDQTLEKKPEELGLLLQTVEKSIHELKTQNDKTYANFMKPYQELNEKIELFFTPVAILQYTKNSKETQEAYSACLPLLTEYSTRQAQDLELFEIYKEIYANEKESLTQAQKKVLEDGIKEFELDGADLPQEKKERIAKINLRLSELGNSFSQNLLDATKAYELIIEDESILEEMPSSDKALAKETKDGKEVYKFTLQPHSFQSFMTYANDSALREQMYKAYTTRAPQNEDIIEETLALRKEMTGILGFENYAEYSLATKMAKDSAEVIGFLHDILKKTKDQAQEELKELEEFAGKKLQSYDTAYYAKKLEKQKFDIDEEAYRPYFEKQSVVDGLLRFLKTLLHVDFRPVDTATWDESVLVYDITEEGEVISRIYMDLESRDEKRGGAWMDTWQSRCIKEDGTLQRASAYIACNFAPAKEGKPSLLKHDDVVTLFHEMGHALHHLLTKVDENFVSGISGVEWDAVEFPSQWLENFAYEKEVLQMFAKHYESKEVLPDSMIQNLIDAKNFHSAMFITRQLEFSLFDMHIHKDAYTKTEVQEILDALRKETALITPPSYNKFQNGFAHIFAGGYAAGYYSYKWAEVLSADAFYLFKDKGVFDDGLGKRFRQSVLALGGSKKAQEVFLEFAGHEPKVDSLLRLNGIV